MFSGRFLMEDFFNAGLTLFLCVCVRTRKPEAHVFFKTRHRITLFKSDFNAAGLK